MILRLRLVLRLLALVLFAGATGAWTSAHAQAELSAHSERIDLWPHVRVLTDATGHLTFEQALAAGDRFAPPKGAYATLGMDKEVVWLRVPVTVQAGGDGQWILDLDYALLRRVDVYAAFEGGVVRHVALGDSMPFSSRPMQGRTHATPLEFTAGSAGELLLRVDTPGGKILPITLSRLPAFHAGALGEQLLQGAFACLGLLLLVYSLAQWIHLREHLYLKYALLVVCSVLFSVHFFGIGEMYVWTDHRWPERHLAGVSSLLAAAATALFVEDALAGDLHRYLRAGLNIVAAVQVAACVAYSANLIDIQTVAVFMSTTGLAPALMGLPGALAKARRGDRIGIWFMVAWVGYFIASAILVGVVRGRIGVSFWTLHSFQIGATLDMLIFMRIAVLRTATRHREAQRAAQEHDRLRALAHSDALTGLLNRRGLDDVLPEALSRATPQRMLALYMMDLDGFKPVNDRHGHDVGDALLRTVAQRLRGSVRAQDGVARLGGDEFVVLAEGLASESQARDLGTKLVEAFRSPFSLGEHKCSVSVTVGFALAPADGWDAATLLKVADAAMYAGKQQGKDRLLRVTG